MAGGKKFQVDDIHAKRGCGEQVIESGEATLMATDGGAVGGGGPG